MSELSIKEYLNARSNGVSAEDFAEHILRNYSFAERASLGDSPIEQAYAVLRRNLYGYDEVGGEESIVAQVQSEREEIS